MAPQHRSFGQNLNFSVVDKYDVLENIIYMYVLSGHDFTQTWEILRWHHQYLPTGPTALVQFRVWERGSADLDTLNEKLIGAMKHALNDVIMEYYFLTSSICLVPHQLQDILPTPNLSAPSSPVVTKGKGQMLELSAISLFIQLNEGLWNSYIKFIGINSLSEKCFLKLELILFI